MAFSSVCMVRCLSLGKNHLGKINCCLVKGGSNQISNRNWNHATVLQNHGDALGSSQCRSPNRPFSSLRGHPRSSFVAPLEARRERRRNSPKDDALPPSRRRKSDKKNADDNIPMKPLSSTTVGRDDAGDDSTLSFTSKSSSSEDYFDFSKGVKLFDDETMSEWEVTSYSWKRRWRRTAGTVFSAMGFVSSASKALVTDTTQLNRVWLPAYEALVKFLQTSEIDLELRPLLNRRLLDNVILLSRIQMEALTKNKKLHRDRRDDALLDRKPKNIPTGQEALRYMKFATAAYGESMIRSAEMDLTGKFNTSALTLLPVDDATNTTRLKSRIRNYCNLQSDEDIVEMDLDFGGNVEHLRHFVAIDHEKKQVILAIRGTFSLAEVVVDAAGYSSPFCGGEGHTEMCKMAQKLWEVVGKKIRNHLKENEGYELIIVGHSLGAGTATLLNILIHHNERDLLKCHQVRCFAFASPPVFTPLGKASKAVKACTNFIHEDDCVSFLSVDSVRHLFNCIGAIEQQNIRWLDRMRLITKNKKPHIDLINVVNRAHKNRLEPKPGAPVLAIPASSNVWLREKSDVTPTLYDAKICDSIKLAHLGIFIDSDMLEDHFPSRYVQAFQHLQ